MSFLISQEWISGGVPSPEVLIKNFVCPSERDPASPLQHPAIPTIAGLTARRTDIFGVRSELFQVDGAVNVRGCHSLFRRSGPPKPYRSLLPRDFPVTGENPGNTPKRLLKNLGFCLSVEKRNVTSGRKNFDLVIRSLPSGSGHSANRYRFTNRRANNLFASNHPFPEKLRKRIIEIEFVQISEL